jgi:hypothetical protein
MPPAMMINTEVDSETLCTPVTSGNVSAKHEHEKCLQIPSVFCSLSPTEHLHFHLG